MRPSRHGDGWYLVVARFGVLRITRGSGWWAPWHGCATYALRRDCVELQVATAFRVPRHMITNRGVIRVRAWRPQWAADKLAQLLPAQARDGRRKHNATPAHPPARGTTA